MVSASMFNMLNMTCITLLSALIKMLLRKKLITFSTLVT